MNMPRDFKGIWICKDLWTDHRLTSDEKILAAEIDSLDCGERHCFASNEYLCEFMNVKERTISQMLSKLRKLGFIEMVGFNGRERQLKSHLKTIYTTFYGSAPQEEKLYKHNFTGLPCTNLLPEPIGDFIERENKEENKAKESLLSPLNPEIEEVSNYIFNKITESKNDFTGTQSNTWKNDCAKLLKKRTVEQIKAAIDWAKEDKACWDGVIICPGKLLQHLDAIEIRMRKPIKNNQDKDKLFFEKLKGRFSLHKQIAFSDNSVQFSRGQAAPLEMKVGEIDFIKKCIDRLTFMKENIEGL